MDSLMDDCSSYSRVSPFRNLRIKGYLLLPEAYRSLSRLSSALSAKASALRPSSLDLCMFHFFRNGCRNVLPSVENIRRVSCAHVFVFRLAIGRIDFVSILSYHRNLMSLFFKEKLSVCSFQGTFPLPYCHTCWSLQTF